MKDERILTLHPEGKKGVNIQRSKYDLYGARRHAGVAACGWWRNDSHGTDGGCQPND